MPSSAINEKIAQINSFNLVVGIEYNEPDLEIKLDAQADQSGMRDFIREQGIRRVQMAMSPNMGFFTFTFPIGDEELLDELLTVFVEEFADDP